MFHKTTLGDTLFLLRKAVDVDEEDELTTS